MAGPSWRGHDPQISQQMNRACIRNPGKEKCRAVVKTLLLLSAYFITCGVIKYALNKYAFPLQLDQLSNDELTIMLNLSISDDAKKTIVTQFLTKTLSKLKVPILKYILV